MTDDELAIVAAGMLQVNSVDTVARYVADTLIQAIGVPLTEDEMKDVVNHIRLRLNTAINLSKQSYE